MSSDAFDHEPARFRASVQDGRYPRPQLARPDWCDLGGAWGFAFDDDDEGLDARWFVDGVFDRTIVVPFPFESAASGIHDPGFHSVVWYSRTLGDDDLTRSGFRARGDSADRDSADRDSTHGNSADRNSADENLAERRLHLRFGAVDYRAMVWIDGNFVGSHEGGQSPFSFDITAALDDDRAEHILVVRAEDDPADVTQPRGKQDWRAEPHSIWYHRTSGIWQPVWLESTAPTAVRLLHWVPDLTTGAVNARVDLNQTPPRGSKISITLSFEERIIGELTMPAVATSTVGVIQITEQRNGQAWDELLWSPEHPRLIDATVTLVDDGGRAIDVVSSYLGLRSARTSDRRFVLNDRPYFVRSVLNQGYWPETHLASPSSDALRRDIELTKQLGFNATRLHQKFEDPRFFYWADRLGLLVWAEAPGAFEFSNVAATRLMTEWMSVMERDISHPSIVTWVPLNESWGVQHIEHSPEMRAFARALVAITRALDGSRPVISNDGWEHVDSDIISVHDYEASGAVLRARYLDDVAQDRLLEGHGPAGRRVVLDGQEIGDRPVMLTEFGGISFATNYADADAWGYSSATGIDDYLQRLEAVVGALDDSTFLAGFCYTQLADTLQETNGLLADDRTPKAPMEALRAIFTRSR